MGEWMDGSLYWCMDLSVWVRYGTVPYDLNVHVPGTRTRTRSLVNTSTGTVPVSKEYNSAYTGTAL